MFSSFFMSTSAWRSHQFRITDPQRSRRSSQLRKLLTTMHRTQQRSVISMFYELFAAVNTCIGQSSHKHQETQKYLCSKHTRADMLLRKVTATDRRTSHFHQRTNVKYFETLLSSQVREVCLCHSYYQ